MTRRLTANHEVDVYTLSCAEHDFCDLRPYSSRHIVIPFNPLPLARRPFGRINQLIRVLDLLRLRTWQQRIASEIDAARYDVVFVHHCQFGQSPSLLSFLKTPSVYYCQEPPRFIYEPSVPRTYLQPSAMQRVADRLDPLPHFYRQVLARLDRTNVLAATRVLVNSAYSRESLYRVYGIFAKVCYLGVDVQRFQPLSLPKGDFVLSVGALTPLKGFEFLVRAFAQMDTAYRPPLVLTSNYTEPGELEYLRELAARLGVTVTFHGQVTDEELVQLYNQARLTVYAPIMEPFGFVLIESMACGTPVIGVAEGGARESVIQEQTGLLVERDPAAFAEATQRLLANSALAEEYGRNGRKHVLQNWTWEKTTAKLECQLTACARIR
jgi:glycosyltransferase involved in cell wall biosynthesis